MKIRRYKKVHRHLNFYINNFGFRKPYQILVDGTFCFAALNNKINIRDDIPKYLQAEVKLLTTPCVVLEMEKLGSKLFGALKIIKGYIPHKCSHKSKPVTGSECFLSMLENNNEKHYMIATQDRDLQDKLRALPGIPLLYLHIKTPVLEEPSEASQNIVKQKMSGLLTTEMNALQELKTKLGLTNSEDVPKKKKKKKGPNPLSCKKKKKGMKSDYQKNSIVSNKLDKQKKKRKKIRIAEHVKEELVKMKTLISS